MDPHEEILSEPIEEKEESKAFRLFKRIALFCVALFLLMLMLTYFLQGNVFDILQGRVVSVSLDDTLQAPLPNGERVLFTQAAYDNLTQYYFANQDAEFKVCMTGEKINNAYQVTGMYVPVTSFRSPISVHARLCDQTTILALHTHPYKRCISSRQDKISNDAFQQVSPQGISAVMCEPNRFHFFGYE